MLRSVHNTIRTSVTVILVAMICARSDSTGAELFEPVRPFVERVESSLGSLPDERQAALNEVVNYVVERLGRGEKASLTFVCTHNSRRSHLAQIWCQVAADRYGVVGIQTYSGGTEATACNVRTVRALRRAGLSIVTVSEGDNPVYLVQASDSLPAMQVYSKVYSVDGNPQSAFAAVMCCSDADQTCPVVAGSDGRFPLHYEDPKVADDTTEETQRYDERCFQIASEMFYIMSRVSLRLDRS